MHQYNTWVTDTRSARIDHIRATVAQPPPSAVSQPPSSSVNQPPHAAVTQSPIQAPHSLSWSQAISTPAFTHPSSAWYHTSSADVGKDYLNNTIIMQMHRKSASRKNFAFLILQERLTYNMNGRGKPKLDENCILCKEDHISDLAIDAHKKMLREHGHTL